MRKATIDNKIVPVVCGTSYKNKGVQKLLDAVIDYMPAPTDIEAIKAKEKELESAMQGVATKVYQAAAAQQQAQQNAEGGAQSNAKDDDVIDADFTDAN